MFRPITAAGLLAAVDEKDDLSWQKRRLQVPVRVTIPRRGPLQLGGCDFPPVPSSPPQRCFSRRGKSRQADPQMPQPLTRFHVPDLRPMVIVEQQLLEGLSCADLREEVQQLTEVKPRSLTCPPLPHLLPHPLHIPSWSSVLPSTQRHWQPTARPVESYTHTDTLGSMNVAITFSRHRTGQSQLHLPSLQPSLDHTLPRKGLQRSLPSATGGKLQLHRTPCAPHALRAVLTHEREPITSSTFVSGHHYPHPE